MKKISKEQLDDLCNHGKAIDSKAGYPCVVLHPDGTATKIWAKKKSLISSATLSPYANRFVKNSQRLAQRGVIVPEILDQAILDGSHIRIVTYRSLPGNSIRDLLKNSPEKVNIHDLCAYFHGLHEKGIFFRANHLGNIIQTPEGGYGLIDFTDVTYQSKPLPLKRRAANIAFPLRYTDDIRLIEEAGLPDILESYLEILQLDSSEKQNFINQVNSYST